MKNPNRNTVLKLELLPNIGKTIASDLRLIGIQKPKDLIGQNPFDLYDKLCIKKEKKIDFCVLDTFMAVFILWKEKSLYLGGNLRKKEN